jgi:hypothetical protein
MHPPTHPWLPGCRALPKHNTPLHVELYYCPARLTAIPRYDAFVR